MWPDIQMGWVPALVRPRIVRRERDAVRATVIVDSQVREPVVAAREDSIAHEMSLEATIPSGPGNVVDAVPCEIHVLPGPAFPDPSQRSAPLRALPALVTQESLDIGDQVVAGRQALLVVHRLQPLDVRPRRLVQARGGIEPGP